MTISHYLRYEKQNNYDVMRKQTVFGGANLHMSDTSCGSVMQISYASHAVAETVNKRLVLMTFERNSIGLSGRTARQVGYIKILQHPENALEFVFLHPSANLNQMMSACINGESVRRARS